MMLGQARASRGVMGAETRMIAGVRACPPSSQTDPHRLSSQLRTLPRPWRVGQEGQVVGVDLNEGMLAVAARTEPDIEWRLGDAASLPFEDVSFDVVVSQFALMYFRTAWPPSARCGAHSRQEDASRSPLGRRSITPAVTRYWWRSPPANADVRQQTCWQRRSSLAIKPGLPSSLSAAASRGERYSP